MTQINFYHLTASPLDKALPRLLEKVITSGARAVVLAENEEQVEVLNSAFWTYTTIFFLPHGSKKDGFSDRQPVYLTADNDNPNGAGILVFLDKTNPQNLQNFEKCLYMFDGADEGQVARARQQWAELKAAGHTLTYWQQNEKGGWEAR